jgi:hypothetical protein
MTLVMREAERVDSRVLGALHCVDASTRVAVDTPLVVEVAGARIRRNRSGLYVIVQADALAAHEGAFDAPPGAPALGSVVLALTLQDPSGRYLPRRVSAALPRDPAPDHAGQVDSLFRPLQVSMYPAAAAPVGANWAALRLSLAESASGDALGGALVIVESGGAIVARGLSDWRGEALVPVPGVPVTTWSDDPEAVVVSEVAAQVHVVFDPAAGTRSPAANVRAGSAPQVLPLADPDDLEARRAALPTLAHGVQLAAGRSQSLSLALALP